MKFAIGKFVLAAALGASVLAAAPAQARDGRYGRHHDGDDAAIAIGAGVLGLAVGAAIASDRNDRYYDDGYYYDDYYYGRPRGYYYSYPRYNYYRYDSYPRYYRYNYNRGWNGHRGYRGGWNGHRGGWGGHHGGRRHHGHRGW